MNNVTTCPHCGIEIIEGVAVCPRCNAVINVEYQQEIQATKNPSLDENSGHSED
jgi:uncharacterized Zn finger protein (UPF0148 family)